MVSGIISNLQLMESRMGSVRRLNIYPVTRYIRYLSILGFWCLCRVLEANLCGCWGMTPLDIWGGNELKTYRWDSNLNQVTNFPKTVKLSAALSVPCAEDAAHWVSTCLAFLSTWVQCLLLHAKTKLTSLSLLPISASCSSLSHQHLYKGHLLPFKVHAN